MKKETEQTARQPIPVPVERINGSILFIRDQKVMLDTDLAELFGATTKAFNQAIKRNRDRFPSDFMFCLTKEEKAEVVTNCDHLLKFVSFAVSTYEYVYFA